MIQLRIFSVILLSLCAAASAAAQPIRLHPDNPHYFLFEERPTVLVTSAEHYGAVVNGAFDYKTYLSTLAADGLNYTRIFAGPYVEDPNSTFGIDHNTLAPTPDALVVPWARSETPGAPAGGNKFDLDRWNAAYFTRLTAFVAEAGRLGIVVEVTLFSSIYHDRNWAVSPLHPENNINGIEPLDFRTVHTLGNGRLLGVQEQFVRKMARALNGFDNVLYEIQNEPWADQTVPALPTNPNNAGGRDEWFARADIATEASLVWQRTIAGYIAGEEAGLPKQHLIAQNYSNYMYPVVEVDSRISVMNFHYAWPAAVTMNAGHGRVVGFDESGFSGKDDATYRRQAWHFLMAGGGLFNNLDYSFAVGYEDGTFEENTSPGHGSRALRNQLSILKQFLEGLDFVRMQPDPALVRHAPGMVPRALAAPGRAFAVYLDDAAGVGRCPLTLALPPGRYAAAWISPATGETLGSETFMHEGGMRTLESPAFETDVALRLEVL